MNGSQQHQMNKYSNVEVFVCHENLRSLLWNTLQRGGSGDLDKIQIISLVGNRFERLDHRTFQQLPNVREVYLQNNRLSRVPADLFDKNTVLELLNLNFNLIAEFDLKLSRMGKLSNLSMNHNRLGELKYKVFRPFLLRAKSSSVLELREQRFKCRCEMFWLSQMQCTKNLTFDPVFPECYRTISGPPERMNLLAGMPVSCFYSRNEKHCLQYVETLELMLGSC